MPGLLPLVVGAALTGSAIAQQCTYNEFPITLVDAAGVPLTNGVASNGETMPLAPTEVVYLAFDPATPSGTYYVHVTDPNITEVVSVNDPTDRFVTVFNDNGTITLSQSLGTGTNGFGLGLNGVGQSLLITPVQAPALGGCRFKLWFSDKWLLNQGPDWPHITRPFDDQTGECANISYQDFQIGDGTPGDVVGSVYEDLNGNGERDAGEPGLAGWEVSLVDGATSTTTTTDANGDYRFVDAGAGSFTTELTVQGGYTATTPTENTVEATACADSDGQEFGVQVAMSMTCEGHSVGYWRNRHGRQLVQQFNILPTLPSLHIVDRCGQYVCPATIQAYARWMRRANSWNMAYKLSAELVATYNSVVVGDIAPFCLIEDPCLGVMTVQDLITQATLSLASNPWTPPCSGSARWQQRKLRNALRRVNKNKIWL